MINARKLSKIEKPRPLRSKEVQPDVVKHLTPVTNTEIESALSELDLICQRLHSTSAGEVNLDGQVATMCAKLKEFGSHLEKDYKDQLDRYFVTLRNVSRDERAPITLRYRLLEITELRALNWNSNEQIRSYYEERLKQLQPSYEDVKEISKKQPQKFYVPNLAQPEVPISTPYMDQYPLQPMGYVPVPYVSSEMQKQSLHPQANIFVPRDFSYQPVTKSLPKEQVYSQHIEQNESNFMLLRDSSPILQPGEIMKSLNGQAEPNKVHGKHLWKEDIVIKNADSGKVMGLKGKRVHMIEELSDTVVSFQKADPSDRERTVTILGPDVDCIGQAKILVEETIRRNASPDRSPSEKGQRKSQTSSNVSFDDQSSRDDHSTSDLDASLEDELENYRYTVKKDGHIIKITGTNLELIRSAKLVLEEYFNNESSKGYFAPLIPPSSLCNQRDDQRMENDDSSSTLINLNDPDFYGNTGASGVMGKESNHLPLSSDLNSQRNVNNKNFVFPNADAKDLITMKKAADFNSVKNSDKKDFHLTRNKSLSDSTNATRNASVGDFNATRNASVGDFNATRNASVGDFNATRNASVGDFNATRNASVGDFNATINASIGDFASETIKDFKLLKTENFPASCQTENETSKNVFDESVNEHSELLAAAKYDNSVHPNASRDDSVHPNASRDDSVHPNASKDSSVRPDASKGDNSAHPNASKGDNSAHPSASKSGYSTTLPPSNFEKPGGLYRPKNEIKRAKKVYSRDFLLNCANYQLSKTLPIECPQIYNRFPSLERKTIEYVDPAKMIKYSFNPLHEHLKLKSLSSVDSNY